MESRAGWVAQHQPVQCWTKALTGIDSEPGRIGMDDTAAGRSPSHRRAIPLRLRLVPVDTRWPAFLWLTALCLSAHLRPCHRQAGGRSQVGLFPTSGYFCHVGAQQGGCSQPGLGVCSLPVSLLSEGHVGKRLMQRGRWRGRGGGGSRSSGQNRPLLLELSGHRSRALVLAAP